MKGKALRGKEGSLIVDGACCLPFLILAVAALLFLILRCGMEETVSHAMVQSARMAVKATADPDGSSQETGGLATSLRLAWLEQDRRQPLIGRSGASLADLTTEQVVLTGAGTWIDQLASFSVTLEGEVLPGFPRYLASPASQGELELAFRPFVGESDQLYGYEDRLPVYVFPNRGQRYHGADCRILKGVDRAVILTEALMGRSRPCSICHPEQLPLGATVYQAQEGRGIYHRQSCAAVTRAYICLPRGQAMGQGYTPCLICGGGP